MYYLVEAHSIFWDKRKKGTPMRVEEVFLAKMKLEHRT